MLTRFITCSNCRNSVTVTGSFFHLDVSAPPVRGPFFDLDVPAHCPHCEHDLQAIQWIEFEGWDIQDSELDSLLRNGWEIIDKLEVVELEGNGWTGSSVDVTKYKLQKKIQNNES